MRFAWAGNDPCAHPTRGKSRCASGRFVLLAGTAAVTVLVVAAASLGSSTAAPSNTSLPSISGSARDGSLVRASHGGWDGKPTSYAYQWLRCDSQGGSCAGDRRRHERHVHRPDRRRRQPRARAGDCDEQHGQRRRAVASDRRRPGDGYRAEEHVGADDLGDAAGGQHADREPRLVERLAGSDVLVPVAALHRHRRRLRQHRRCDQHDLRVDVGRRRAHGPRRRDGEELARLDGGQHLARPASSPRRRRPRAEPRSRSRR